MEILSFTDYLISARFSLVGKYLYLFIDEGGNFDFSPSGTKYFTITCLSKFRPFKSAKELSSLKYDLIEAGHDTEYFHASEDNVPIRNSVFEIIEKNLDGIYVDTLIVEKSKTNPALYTEEHFYSKMVNTLMKYVINRHNVCEFDGVIVFTDCIPIKKKRKAVEKALKINLKQQLEGKCRYSIFHHDSKSNFDLQIVDYFNWVVYRKWTENDLRYYSRLNSVIKSEFDIFKSGKKKFY